MLVRMIKNDEIRISPRSRRVFSLGATYTLDSADALALIKRGSAVYAGVGAAPVLSAEQTATLATIADAAAAEAFGAADENPAVEPEADVAPGDGEGDDPEEDLGPVTAEDLAEHSDADLKSVAKALGVAHGKKSREDLIAAIVEKDAERFAGEGAAA